MHICIHVYINDYKNSKSKSHIYSILKRECFILCGEEYMLNMLVATIDIPMQYFVALASVQEMCCLKSI